MAEITDTTIKRKHKEFNDRIRRVLEEVRGKEQGEFSPAIHRLRQAVMEARRRGKLF